MGAGNGERWASLVSNLRHLDVLSAKHFSYRGPLLGPPHSHPHTFHISYVISGRATVRVENSVLQIGPSDVLFVRPRQLHASADDRETTFELIEIKFAINSPGVEQSVPEIGPDIRTPNTSAVVPALERVVMARLVDLRDDNWLVRVRLAETLMLLAKEASLSPVAESSVGGTTVRMHQAAEYIAVHYAEPLTIEQIADLAGMSPNHFVTTFGRSMGISPMEMVIQMRMYHAKEMLRTSDLAVSQIAEACGFHSPQYFTRFFTRREHRAPREYRADHR
jgi:AraC-like DNA-binding protein/quercetin dioxygenase-like cupin family protein